MAGFMAQTGDGQNFNGTGRSKYPEPEGRVFQCSVRARHGRMARRGDSVDTANSQFFIMFKPTASLERPVHRVGQVVSGMDVVDKLKKAPPGSTTAPSPDPDKMREGAGSRYRRSMGGHGEHCRAAAGHGLQPRPSADAGASACSRKSRSGLRAMERAAGRAQAERRVRGAAGVLGSAAAADRRAREWRYPCC